MPTFQKAVNTRIVEFEGAGVFYRGRRGGSPRVPVVALLHGLGGDETSMGVFEHALPSDWAIAAPRGMYVSARGGYSWTESPASTHLEAFDGAVQRIRRWVDETSVRLGSDPRHVLWMGFSQGAALALAAVLQGAPALGLVSLAGFLPEGSTRLTPGLCVFWAHGRRDLDVPVARARADVDRLRSLGADVEFCEADVDHRVGAPCLTALRGWLDRFAPPPEDSRNVS